MRQLVDCRELRSVYLLWSEFHSANGHSDTGEREFQTDSEDEAGERKAGILLCCLNSVWKVVCMSARRPRSPTNMIGKTTVINIVANIIIDSMDLNTNNTNPNSQIQIIASMYQFITLPPRFHLPPCLRPR